MKKKKEKKNKPKNKTEYGTPSTVICCIMESSIEGAYSSKKTVFSVSIYKITLTTA